MTRTAVERDDILHEIGETLAFYGKRLDETGERFWLSALGPDVSAEDVRRALHRHTREGRYAPKPADVIDQLATFRTRGDEHQERRPRGTPCSPELAAAWVWFIGKVAAMGRNAQLGGALSVPELDPDTEERYLRMVNEQAHKHGEPEAIPDALKIPEIWQQGQAEAFT
jgi:hypothetical protein